MKKPPAGPEVWVYFLGRHLFFSIRSSGKKPLLWTQPLGDQNTLGAPGEFAGLSGGAMIFLTSVA